MNNQLVPGDCVPWFKAPELNGNSEFHFASIGGRFILLLFHGSGGWPQSKAALELLKSHQELFDDIRACFFGVTIDPSDVALARLMPPAIGIHWFLDYDHAVSKACGALHERSTGTSYQPHWLLVDRTLRIFDRGEIGEGERVFNTLRTALNSPDELTHPPILSVPRVLEPELCAKLIADYERHGGSDSGFMYEEAGITLGRSDHSFKRRSDHHIVDASLQREVMVRLHRFLKPMMARAFQFQATRIERWLVACYDSGAQSGFFRAHRDNTTLGTAHRKFACTINLNSDDYSGGELAFPEYGSRLYKPNTGEAIIFSCSILHEARPVRSGRRYAFLPFFYDEAGASVRKKNMKFVEPDHRSSFPE